MSLRIHALLSLLLASTPGWAQDAPSPWGSPEPDSEPAPSEAPPADDELSPPELVASFAAQAKAQAAAAAAVSPGSCGGLMLLTEALDFMKPTPRGRSGKSRSGLRRKAGFA